MNTKHITPDTFAKLGAQAHAKGLERGALADPEFTNLLHSANGADYFESGARYWLQGWDEAAREAARKSFYRINAKQAENLQEIIYKLLMGMSGMGLADMGPAKDTAADIVTRWAHQNSIRIVD